MDEIMCQVTYKILSWSPPVTLDIFEADAAVWKLEEKGIPYRVLINSVVVTSYREFSEIVMEILDEGAYS